MSSWPVNAFMSPPTDSTASAISARVARLGALEQQVLEEVTRAGDRVGLVARAGADPEPDRRPSARPGRRSVTTRSPESRRVRRMPDASSTIAAVIDADRRGLTGSPRLGAGAPDDRRAAAAAATRRRHRRRSPPRSPPGRPASAGPRSPNSACACESQDVVERRRPRRPSLAAAARRCRSPRSPRSPLRAARALPRRSAAARRVGVAAVAARRARHPRARARACPSCRCRRRAP